MSELKKSSKMNGNETDIRNHYSEQFCDGGVEITTYYANTCKKLY